jgi:hypothetical protein
MSEPVCRDHPSVASAAECAQCARPLCEVCTFRFAGRPFCPDCAVSGPAASERSAVVSGGVISIVLAVVGFVGLAAAFAAGTAGIALPQGANLVLGWVLLGTSVGGLAVGVVARDGARRTGSALPMVGTIASSLLLLLVMAFSIIGSMT